MQLKLLGLILLITNEFKKKKGGKAHILSGETNIAVIRFLSKKIGEIEKAVLKRVKLREEYEKLLTAPGIGKILALTIMLETGDIRRFAKVGNYSSYCRCVKSEYITNNKKGVTN